MKKTVDLISVAGLIFAICLTGAWDSGYITGINAMMGVIVTVSSVIASGFVCSLISSLYSTRQRRYAKRGQGKVCLITDNNCTISHHTSYSKRCA